MATLIDELGTGKELRWSFGLPTTDITRDEHGLINDITIKA